MKLSNNNKLILFLKDMVLIITAVFPLALSMGVCSGAGIFAGIVLACITAIFAQKPEIKMPVYTVFLILCYTFKTFSMSTVSLAIIIAGLLLIICSLFYKKLMPILYSPFSSAVMIATALSVTVLFTTDYFGIGAMGNTVVQMLASYRSLGFHANWRGVLYGTIVMVVMITFPRKFKKFCKTVNASFIALFLTLILNLFLNPSFMPTAINEIGNSAEYFDTLFLAPICLGFDKPDFIGALFSGVALLLPCLLILLSNKADKKEILLCGISSCIFGFSCSCPVPSGIKKKNWLSGITAAVIILAVYLLFPGIIGRIPVHSCAVVLIVGAWQSVAGLKIKFAFSSAASIICFILCSASCLLLGMVHGIIISVLIFGVFLTFAKNKVTIKDS